jgi:putative transposase
VNSIHLHNDSSRPARWIGIDLNTTGHAVVAADLVTGKILKLGKRLQYAQTSSTNNCTKLYREGKLWKLKKMKTRERKEFKASLNKISRQIVSFAESSCAGIKFEKLFTYRYLHHKEVENPYEFSFENSSFISLLHLVEKRALSRGIPVLYVNPANTSKRCSRCGSFGRRVRKRFECPHCGAVIHADVNAAFNIAATAHDLDKFEIDRMRMTRKEIRRRARARLPPEEEGRSVPVPDLTCPREVLIHGDALQMILGEGQTRACL